MELQKRDVGFERSVQYGGVPEEGVSEIEGPFFNAAARRRLYRYAADGRDIRQEGATWLAREFSKKSTTVVDLGCNDGDYLRLLHQMHGLNTTAFGIDISQNQLMIAEQVTAEDPATATAPIEYIALNLDRDELPFEDNTADVVILDNVIYHLENPFFTLSEASRIVKPGGILKVSSRGPDNQERLWRLGALAANKMDAELAGSFYSQFDMQRTQNLEPHLPGFKLEKTITHETDLHVPLDGDSHRDGWSDYRLALTSLHNIMVNRDKKEWFPERYNIPNPAVFNRVVDTDIWSIFYSETRHRLATEGSAYFRDQAQQGSYFYRKTN